MARPSIIGQSSTRTQGAGLALLAWHDWRGTTGFVSRTCLSERDGALVIAAVRWACPDRSDRGLARHPSACPLRYICEEDAAGQVLIVHRLVVLQLSPYLRQTMQRHVLQTVSTIHPKADRAHVTHRDTPIHHEP